MLHVLTCLPWLALLAWLAAEAWFLCDDAFISFRYVRNLIEGHGLVFNPGERVEGYTNFLWVLELAALWGALGLRPEHAAPWLSVACTAATIGVVLWWVIRIPGLQQRRLISWVALGLLCSSATFAVWTSGGGLETRQFTLFVVLAIVCVTVHGDSRWGLLTASLSLSAASYTRPEGPLIAACCISWFVGTRLATKRVRLIGRELCWLLGPLVVLISAHYLFRYTYYGEWLPNTYYAKHVRPWYESGFRYLWAAALETGLYLWLPLAALALRKAWQQRWDGRYALPLLCVVLHMVYLFRIGGDHFEYRPLDFYWPMLAVPVAAGIVCCGAAIHERLGLLFRHVGTGYVGGPVTWAVAVFAVVLFYSSAFQGVLLFEGSRTIRTRIPAVHIEVNEDNARWLLAAPGMPMIVAISNDLRRQMIRQLVAAPFVEHREFANLRIAQWKDYDRMERGLIPDDAVMAANTIGIPFYYVPDLRVVDTLGLTDATVARHPVTTPNRYRIMAHDRRPPPGYLDERGVNFRVYESAGTAREALDRATYAVLVGEDLWMPFDSSDPGWVVSRFGDRLIGFTDGWYARETGEKSFWRWTQQTARVLFSNPRTAAVLHLDYDARADLFQASPRTLTITVGGQVAHSFALEAAGRQQINVLLPELMLGGGDRVEVQIAVDRLFVLANVIGGSTDTREFGIQIFRATLERPPTSIR